MRYCTVFLIVLPFAAQAQHGMYVNESKNPAMGDPKAIAAGAKLYAQSCSPCHGPDGSGGRGPNLVRRTLWHPLTDEAIFHTIRSGVPGADMPPTKLPDNQTWDLVAFIHSLTGPAAENDIPGDVATGEQIFWGAKAGCANCHAIRGRGSRMGPDLTNVGGSDPYALIRRALVDPERKLSLAGQESVVVTLKNGQIIRGIARSRSNFSVHVVDSQGALHMIPMSSVKELNVSEDPMMPQDYAKRLSPAEIRDLLAFLSRQTVRPIESQPKKEVSSQ